MCYKSKYYVLFLAAHPYFSIFVERHTGISNIYNLIKNAEMKKFLLITAIVTSMIALSCSKETDTLSTANFNVEEAKTAFVNNYTIALETKSADEIYYSLAGGDYTPVWEMAKANENEHIWSLEVPIISDLQIVLKNKETELVTRAERKLLFIKSKETQNVHPFIMVSTTSEAKSNNSSFEHLADNSSYTGYVLYSTLAGEFVNLRSYENGEETANVNAMTVETEHHHDCDSTCTDHGHNLSLEEVMGNNEFGIMPRGNSGGDFYEGICTLCGGPEPLCWCFICRNCLQEDCVCGDYCNDCEHYPCVCDTHICLICGEYNSQCICSRVLCHECGNFLDECVCEKDHETYCSECGDYHVVGDCKYICHRCKKFLSICVCK